MLGVVQGQPSKYHRFDVPETNGGNPGLAKIKLDQYKKRRARSPPDNGHRMQMAKQDSKPEMKTLFFAKIPLTWKTAEGSLTTETDPNEGMVTSRIGTTTQRSTSSVTRPSPTAIWLPQGTTWITKYTNLLRAYSTHR
jgi:hypothetical protein